ncbi:tail fiber protein, partial [Escherichia coli]
MKEFEFTSESAGIIRAYKARLSGTTWSVAKVYTSLDKPTANDISALGMRTPVTGTVVVNLNDMYGPDYYGATAIKSTASAVAANNYPFDEVGTVLVLPFGDTFSCTQLYVTQSGRVAARSYDGSTWTPWRKQANSGVNDDITQLTALSGPLRLGGDAVGDYDAVTMRQLRSVSGGAGGPSMNGVMNYGVGDFHLRDSRAFIQPYEVVSDGQLLNRADWPELWAYAQMLSPISDTEWLADASKRGKYSNGDGTTTFRVPDRNGVQQG